MRGRLKEGLVGGCLGGERRVLEVDDVALCDELGGSCDSGGGEEVKPPQLCIVRQSSTP